MTKDKIQNKIQLEIINVNKTIEIREERLNQKKK